VYRRRCGYREPSSGQNGGALLPGEESQRRSRPAESAERPMTAKGPKPFPVNNDVARSGPAASRWGRPDERAGSPARPCLMTDGSGPLNVGEPRPHRGTCGSGGRGCCRSTSFSASGRRARDLKREPNNSTRTVGNSTIARTSSTAPPSRRSRRVFRQAKAQTPRTHPLMRRAVPASSRDSESAR
jgi:hypothetical protein